MRLCECGCGEPAPIARSTDAKRGYVKGQPRRFIRGHAAKGHRHARKDERVRKEDRGYKTPCHVWLLSLSEKGYGQEWDPQRKRTNGAHRLAYERAHGSIPDDTEIDHLCAQRDCVNPEHLEAVAHVVNVHRGRLLRITPEQRDRVAALVATGLLTYAQIGQAVGISATSVARIVREARAAA